MKLSVKKILFWFVFLCAGVCLLMWRMPMTIQTNLNSLINFENQDWPVNELTGKFSDVVNIVIESENITIAKDNASEIMDMLASGDFNNLSVINTNFSLSSITDNLSKHRNSFLGHNFRNLLKQGDFNTIVDNAVANITSFVLPTVLPLKDDPFLLTTDYIHELNSQNSKWGLRDGFLWQFKAPNNYILISVNVNNSGSDELITTMDLLQNKLQKYNNNDSHVFISGVPVHTAVMTKTSKMQLGIFSALAVLVAILLNWLLFRKSSTLWAVILSLSAGFIGGAIALFLCFNNPHILTFVFGVTLIGLGIDYSFHFISAFTSKNNKSVHKNILHSFLTTIVCFLPLLFSGLSLLQQISVFTIVGLGIIYIGWIIFMPKNISTNITKTNMPRPIYGKYRNFIIWGMIVAVCATLPFVRIQNNMSQLYRPNNELLQAEALMQDLSGMTNSNFLIIRGKDLDSALAVSEKIKDESGNFFDLSTIMPSESRQIENQGLIRTLYKHKSKTIQNELGLRTRPYFIETPLVHDTDIKSDKTLGIIFDKFVFDDGRYTYIIANVGSEFKTDNTNAIIISPAQQLTDIMTQYSYESYRLLLMCGIGLILLLIVLYKKRAFIYLAPSILAVGLTVSILTWFGKPITCFHLLSLFIVIGLCLDYSIFHINAQNNREIKPVLFSFLTSFIGFGILSFASFFLIQSMGITLALGLSIGYLISLFLFRRTK